MGVRIPHLAFTGECRLISMCKLLCQVTSQVTVTGGGPNPPLGIQR
nr:MAG TPA: hypothetical protein [Caudoviricetes sp.]